MFKKIPKPFYYFLSVFLLLNLVQSYFTELIFDESYYWYYSQNMAWGYFDHPPMVALLIKISSLFFDGELGVRFMSCLLSAANLIVLWLLIDHPKKKDYVVHFFVLTFSMTLLNAYGFFTLPDTPLLFFTSCFLLIYKKFIEKPSLGLSVLLGIVMACLMYSKYHAVLVILFVLLSNFKLLKNRFAWYAVIVALLCYMPHFYWLYDNNLVSIKYHLYERPNGAYSFEKYTLGYFVNLVAIFGLTFPFIYYALFKTKASSLFNKALLFLTYGVLIFFFISSFNRRIQTQWIIIICIPMVIITFNYMLVNRTSMRWIYRLGLANVVVILYLRVGLVHQPLLFNVFYESHGNKDWVKQIKDEVGDMPVVFENSYRRAPMYAFYSGGNTSFSLNNVQYRKNQYSIEDTEEEVRNREVLYVSKYITDGTFDYTKTDGSVFHANYIENFNSYRKLECIVETSEEKVSVGQEISLKVYNPYEFDIKLNTLKFAAAYLDNYKKTQHVIPILVSPMDSTTTVLISKDTTNFTTILPKTKKDSLGYVRIVISENGLYFGLNGKPIPLQ
ncbi:glycosyltransferase family 39 protein [Maribacter sp. MJ134]|uniref:ArnT family glycosyltransferase n=1 Tax=Maribacter sp. MJ134 TaxID=2496865 RepID=UPI000F82B282|nr:glycosyltransferase family 39 protein [Maribacter sp. MJ134]AZQ60150.1 glycosyltransferase family 39 protein [Maribacter sp. MJ134]